MDKLLKVENFYLLCLFKKAFNNSNSKEMGKQTPPRSPLLNVSTLSNGDKPGSSKSSSQRTSRNNSAATTSVDPDTVSLSSTSSFDQVTASKSSEHVNRTSVARDLALSFVSKVLLDTHKSIGNLNTDELEIDKVRLLYT